MTDRGKQLLGGIAFSLLFWVVIFGTAAMALQRWWAR